MQFFGTKVIPIFPKTGFAIPHYRSKKALFHLKNCRNLDLSFLPKFTMRLYFKSINIMNKKYISKYLIINCL
jgi:hypothetical protein